MSPGKANRRPTRRNVLTGCAGNVRITLALCVFFILFGSQGWRLDMSWASPGVWCVDRALVSGEFLVPTTLHSFDLVGSGSLLTLGVMEEANPLGAAIYGSFGIAGLALFKFLAVLPALLIIARIIPVSQRLRRLICVAATITGAVATLSLLAVVRYWLAPPGPLDTF
jgi:hypothetical protein